MWTVKIYAFVWLFVAAAAAVLYATGMFDSAAADNFGNILSILFLAGSVIVIPLWADERYPARNRVG